MVEGDQVDKDYTVATSALGITVQFKDAEKAAEKAGITAATLALHGINGERPHVTKDHAVTVTGMSETEFDALYKQVDVFNSFRDYARNNEQAVLDVPKLRYSSSGTYMVSFPRHRGGAYKALETKLRNYGVQAKSKTLKGESREVFEIATRPGENVLALLDECVKENKTHTSKSTSSSLPKSSRPSLLGRLGLGGSDDSRSP